MLISYLRHELHTSLNAVIGYSELLLEDASSGGTSGIATGLHAILDACHTLLNLVGERISSSKLQELDSVALTELMREVFAASQAPTGLIVATGAELIAIAEQEGKYGLIPDLCKIQAAGNMLQDLLDRQSSLTFQSAALAPVAVHAQTQVPPPGGGRILIIDDNSMSRDLLRQTLERQGHHVAEASGGAQGLEFLAEQSYDLILLDLRMPDLSGFEVLEQLVARGRLSQMMVVMLSASGEIDDVARCIERGAADYLIKPVNLVVLRTRIASYLELKRLREQVRLLQETHA